MSRQLLAPVRANCATVRHACFLAVATLAATSPAMPQPRLTAAVQFSAYTNGSLAGGEIWNTTPNDGRFGLWVIKGQPGGAFVNGPADAASSIDIPLAAGRNTFTIHGEPGNNVTGYFGLNLFFGGNSSAPRISAIVPVNASSPTYFPSFVPNSSHNSVGTYDWYYTQAAGTVAFTDQGFLIRLSSCQWSLPGVYNSDRVGPWTTGASGAADFVGQFTLDVLPLPRLTGAVQFSAYPSGALAGGEIWNTTPNDGRFGLWVMPGEPGGVFANGPAEAQSDIDIPLAPGVHTFTIRGEPGYDVTGYFGSNLFFNGNGATPRISLIAPVNNSTPSTFPPFMPNASAESVGMVGSNYTQASGAVSFSDQNFTVELSGFQWSLPNVYNSDQVGPWSIGASGAPDFVGRFTLTVTALNTAPGGSVAIQPVDSVTGTQPVSLSFSNVTQSGATTLTTSTTGAPPPSGFKLGNPPTYFDLTTTASFSGPVTVCFNYTNVSFSNESKLKLFHQEGTQWVDRTVSIDTTNNIICASVGSFSWFTLAEDARPAVTNAGVAPNPIPVGTASVIVSATASDLGTGARPIVSAQYRLNGGAWTPAAPSDGVFDSPVEVVAATVALGVLSQQPGVVNVCVRATDLDGYVSGESCVLLAIYDPGAGFVTGGGTFASPAGALTAEPTLTGRASFGFVARYAKGATTPSGSTQFLFHAAGFDFRSTLYEWLVVAGARAQFKGTGNVNGDGDYAFLLTAIDGEVSGGGGIDRFRLKVWDRQSGLVVYDNQRGSDDSGNAASAVETGSIIVRVN